MKLINYKENLTNCCIYKIGFEGYDYFYIGSTSCLRKRKETHLRNLQNNKHTSPRLQRVYNKYSEKCYFEVVDTSTKNKLFELEQYYIDKNQEKLLNCCRKAGKPPGPNDYRKVADKIKKTMFDRNYNRYLKIQTLMDCGVNVTDIIKLCNCSSKTVIKVKELFGIPKYGELPNDVNPKTIRIVKRYFRFIKLQELRKNKSNKVLSSVYKKITDRFNLEKSTIINIAKGKIYKYVEI